MGKMLFIRFHDATRQTKISFRSSLVRLDESGAREATIIWSSSFFLSTSPLQLKRKRNQSCYDQSYLFLAVASYYREVRGSLSCSPRRNVCSLLRSLKWDARLVCCCAEVKISIPSLGYQSEVNEKRHIVQQKMMNCTSESLLKRNRKSLDVANHK